MSQIETIFAVNGNGNGNANGHPHVSSSAATDPSISMASESDRAIPNSADALINSAAVGKMILNLNREIRMPLASILGMTQMLLGTDLDDSQKEFVDAVDANARTIASVVSALADSSRFLASGMNRALGANSKNDGRSMPITAEAMTRAVDTVVEHPLKDDAETVVIAAGPPIDPVAMNDLREIGADDEGFLKGLIDLFLSDLKERLATMKAAVDARDLGPIRSTAHLVKGSSGHFGAARLASWCRKMELIDPENLARDADGVFAQLNDEADLVRTALQLERNAPTASAAGAGSI
jgi:HPt (histidine-containing phosphotransfer) domain-containing protein